MRDWAIKRYDPDTDSGPPHDHEAETVDPPDLTDHAYDNLAGWNGDGSTPTDR
jgi:hypothetical protein